MASNKNQHFVPKCHLRPFSQDGRGAAINLLNIDSDRLVRGASVRDQCSGDYFYGKDPKFEKSLQGLEGLYASVVAEVAREGYVLLDLHKTVLRDFCCLQYLRTAAAAKRAIQMMADAGEVAKLPEDWSRMSILEAVLNGMSAFPQARAAIQDLKVVLVRNRTSRQILTSDNPAVFTNRWYLTDPRLLDRSPGLESAGALFMLPLRPDVLCVVYDGDVYAIPHEGGWVEIDRDVDVLASNEHQILNCWANLYFKDWDGRDLIRQHVESVRERRPAVRHEIRYAVFDHTGDTGDVFRVVESADAEEHERAIIHQRAILPVPSRWPRFLRWRGDGRAYDDGSEAGYVRLRAAALAGGASSRVPTRMRR